MLFNDNALYIIFPIKQIKQATLLHYIILLIRSRIVLFRKVTIIYKEIEIIWYTCSILYILRRMYIILWYIDEALNSKHFLLYFF